MEEVFLKGEKNVMLLKTWYCSSLMDNSTTFFKITKALLYLKLQDELQDIKGL